MGETAGSVNRKKQQQKYEQVRSGRTTTHSFFACTRRQGMTARMAACNLGPSGPTRKLGLLWCTSGSDRAAYQALPSDSRASLLLVRGTHDRICTRRSNVRPARTRPW